MKQGSVTVFLALVLVLIMSFLFSLLEGVRVHGLEGRANILSDLCVRSVFADYHAGVWADYHLLFLDAGNSKGEFSKEGLEGRMMKAVTQNLDSADSHWGSGAWELTDLAVQETVVEKYELATDGAGRAFLYQVCEQMQLEAAEHAWEEVKKLLGMQKEKTDFKKKLQEKDSNWEQAWDAIGQAENSQDTESAKGKNKAPEQKNTFGQPKVSIQRQSVEQQRRWAREKEIENPMEYVREIKKSSILALLLKDGSKLSVKELTGDKGLENRQMQTGNWGTISTEKSMERVWLQYYLQQYFSSYCGGGVLGPKERALDYELEYVLGGKRGDSENLEKVLWELLGIREVLNFATLMKDSQKKALAFSIATAAVGATGLLPLIKAVQIGVLCSWAFIESVIDVRSLLEGGQVPLLKQTSQWSSDLTDFRGSLKQDSTPKKEEVGLNYMEYLQMLLFLLPQETIVYRCMDLIEQNEQVRMDCMVQSLEGCVIYEAEPLFWSFNLLKRQSLRTFEFAVSAGIRYVGN